MTIIDFDFDPELLKQFLDFPKRQYASDSNWIPDSTEGHLLTAQHSHSHCRNFLAFNGDEIDGRITAIINPRVCDENKQPFGQLGFFECKHDVKIAESLISAGVYWLRENLPTNATILAPMNFDTWHNYRFRTKGFDQPTFFMEPYNPPCYPNFFTMYGFTPVSTYITKTVHNLSALLAFWKPYHQTILERGFRVRSLNLNALAEELALIYHLSLTMFRENLFFVDISEAEFRALYSGTANALDPDLFLFLLNPAEEVVGLCFNIVDHRHPQTVNVKTFGILPHVRSAGVGAGFAYEIYSRFMQKGFTTVNHCLMRAGNRADNFDGGFGEVTREYTLFAYSLDT